jgi:hypothetical protein
MSNPARSPARVAATNSSRTRSMSARDISRGTCIPSRYAWAVGAMVSQLPSSSGSSFPSHIRRVDPFGPECPSWRQIRAGDHLCTASVIRRHACTWWSRYMPVHPGLMRPSGETQVISVTTSPAPPSARAPRWMRWNSFGVPSSAEYMSIGETTTRFRSSRSRSLKGVNMGGGTWDFGRGTSDVSAAVVPGPTSSVLRPENHRSTSSTYVASRSRRFS